MASSSNFDVRLLMSKGKRATAAYVLADCSKNPHNPERLYKVLANLLNPYKRIDDWEAIEWCKWLMARGQTPDEYAATVRKYDNATTCGLVWTPNFVAYRCRTCGISPCMSLCSECFKRGKHETHDYNMFKSLAGGACDCGDTSVMKETGFCDNHGPGKGTKKLSAPSDLMFVADAMMPFIIFRLILHLRESSAPSGLNLAVQDADPFITMLLEFNNMGGLMRKVMTGALTNPEKYKELNEVYNSTAEDAEYLARSRQIYQETVNSLPAPEFELTEELRDCPSLQSKLVHRTFLEELVFWMVKLEFPQKMVCLLLNVLPDPDYKEALTRAFVLHYSRISVMLERCGDPDGLSNRVVHVSVQLFSNERLALKMTEQLNLLHVMVLSLKTMLSKILIRDTSHYPERNCHFVVNCDTIIMHKHCYWPLVSDLNNVLSHRPVALKFIGDDTLLQMWFSYLAMFQGMNVNQREIHEHINFEPNTYYAAYSAELEASAYPMWALVSHLTDSSTAHLTRRIIQACLNEWNNWLDLIRYRGPIMEDILQASFHYPLHRYLAVFVCQGVTKQGLRLGELLPQDDVKLFHLLMHPLKVQVAFYEILAGLWVRNGLQIKAQAMTYIQTSFCASMVDTDIYLLQTCCTRVNTEKFLQTLIDQFHLNEFMSLLPFRSGQNPFNEEENDTPMLESCLTFLATLMTVRNNLGVSEAEISKLEMATVLCMSDKTHSQLLDSMPERSGSQNRTFEADLESLADYKSPVMDGNGQMQPGTYTPKAIVWEELYDPIHILLRAVHRNSFQDTMDRYINYCRQAKKIKPGVNPWPPFRTPAKVGDGNIDPRHILTWNMFQSMSFVILYKAVKGLVSEHVMALIVFLLEQSILITNEHKQTYSKVCVTPQPNQAHQIVDGDLANWFNQGYIFDNFRTVIPKVIFPTTVHDIGPSVSLYCPSDSDEEGNSSGSDDVTMSPPPESREQFMLEDRQSSDAFTHRNAPLMLYTGPRDSMVTEEFGRAPESPVEMFASPLAILPSELMEVDNLAVELSAPRSVIRHTNEYVNRPVVQQPLPLPALTAGNEVARRETTSMESIRRNEPSTAAAMMPSTSYGTKRRTTSRSRLGPTEYSEDQPSVEVGESIISLLLKLHSMLSGIPDSFNPDDTEVEYFAAGKDKAPCGDGPFYVGRLLMRMARSDESCRRHIQEARKLMWPSTEEHEKAMRMRENKEREERRRKAKERQEKLMAEMQKQQNKFWNRARMSADEFSAEMESMAKTQEVYSCAICNTSSPSTEDNPVGVTSLIQSTSVLGHRRRLSSGERFVLPVTGTANHSINRDDTLSSDFDKRLEELDRHFDPQSWFLSINSGWDGGVQVHTCGHHLHVQCLYTYLNSLRTQPKQQGIVMEKGEFTCPICRQLSNTVIPLMPQYGDKSQMVKTHPNSEMGDIINEISTLLKDNDEKPSSSRMAEAIGRVMEDMSNNSSQQKAFFRNDKPTSQSLFLYVTSIARTNLEMQLLWRNGSLVRSNEDPPHPLVPKRDCILPLLHVLSVHARVTRSLIRWPAWMVFQQLCNSQPKESIRSLALVEREVPILLKDPIALLLQFVLLLPLPLDQTYFTTLVQMVYNLVYYQVAVQVSCNLPNYERLGGARDSSHPMVKNYGEALALINRVLSNTDLYMDGNGETSSRCLLNVASAEQQVQKLCLPFLRIASLLKFYIYEQSLPDIPTPENEFVELVDYLNLVNGNVNWNDFNASSALNWPKCTDLWHQCPQSWFEEFAVFVSKSPMAARSFLSTQSELWSQPKLVQLPYEYEKLFTYYHERPCSKCQTVPGASCICLICGTIICWKQSCCKQQNVAEAVTHAQECGSGTGIFLMINSTMIILIRGYKSRMWGSIYLDEHAEEDRDLKRGRPLYLSKDRFNMLEQQWLGHRFDCTGAWLPHRNLV